MARSAKKSITIPHPLVDGLHAQTEQGILNYRSNNGIHVGFARYQLMHGKEHTITAEIDRLCIEDQDIIDDFLRDLNDRGLALGGSFLRHIIDRAIAGTPEPDPKVIERRSAHEILELAKRWANGDETVWDGLSPRTQEFSDLK